MWEWERVHPESLLGRLRTLADPRRRQARIYPLASIIAVLVLAAANGESSLRGMWLWAKARWEGLADELGFWDVSRPPALTTIWNVLGQLDEKALEAVLTGWVVEGPAGEERALSIDGKHLRGSKRQREAALEVVTVAGQTLRQVLGQVRVSEGDTLEATLEVLRALPLTGKVVSMDAGTLQRAVAETVVEKGGPILGC